MSSVLSPNRPLAHATAYAVSILGTAIGVGALFRPADFASSWGLPSESNSAWVYAMGGRNISMGLALLNFTYRGKLKEVGAFLMCGSVTAGIDAVVTWMFGDRSVAWKHIIPAILFTGFGWYLQY